MKNFFIVTCAGMSGSKWLASVLEKHPKISSSHSAGMYKIYDRNYTEEEIVNILEIEREQFANTITLFDIFNKIGNKNIVNGNVHAFRLYRLKEAITKCDSTPLFRLANLVRHPLKVTLSRAAMFEEMCKHDETVRKRLRNTILEYKKHYSDIIEKHQLDLGNFYILSFLDAVMGLQKLSDEIKNNPDVYHICVEDLKEPANYIKLVDFLSSGTITTTLEEAKMIVETPIINSHTKERNKISIKTQFDSLEDWKQELLARGFNDSGIILQYEKLGYRFDFIHLNGIG